MNDSTMQSMTPKQRLLRILRGQPVDRPAFSPFLAYYFEYLPEAEREKGMLAYLQQMGADPLLRGWGFAYEVVPGCKVESVTEGPLRTTVYHTPLGDMRMEHRYVEKGNTWFLTRHPVSTLEDMRRLQAYFEAMTIRSKVEELNAVLSELGDAALALPLVGTEFKSAYQSLLETWVGTENLVYLTYDYPDEMGALLEVMRAKNLETVRFTAQSWAEAVIFWEDTSTTNLSPALYQQYIEPEITQWAAELAKADIMLVQHACGHLKALLPTLGGQGIAAVESLTPTPTGNVNLEEAFELLPPEVAIIGGIDPVFLLSSSLDELDAYVNHVLDLADGRRFLLANSDSCPPGVAYEKFTRIVEIIKKRGLDTL